MNIELEHHRVKTNGITLHVVQSGPQNGPLIILLHGFPEFWYSWRGQIESLAAAGYRVWVPDQRGYNLSDKPTRIADYKLDTLAADVVGLIEAAGREQAVVVGHDWGAAVAWWVATCHPDRVARLTILNVPHPSIMPQVLRTSPSQLLKSWYIFFFQIPWLPEFLTSLGGWKPGLLALQRSSRPGTFGEADLRAYREAWSQPRAMTSMINWYRAAFRSFGRMAQADQRVTVPVQIIWGAKDAFLNPKLAQLSLDICDNGRLTYLPQASHWIQHEEPAEVNRLLLEFIGPVPAGQ